MQPVEPYAEECDCSQTVWVWRIIKGGTKQYGRQCLFCGRMRVTKKSAVPLNVELQQFCQELVDQYHERRKRFFERRARAADAEREAKQSAWWEMYNEYLDSEKWKAKRERVLQRDDWMCQACLKRQADEVHHLTYEHVFNEPLFDLISICSVCHRKLTELDRCNR